MKKVIMLIAILILTGCEDDDIVSYHKNDSIESYTVNKTYETMIHKETIICREGKKIWVAWHRDEYAGGLTSQIVGTCEP